MGKSFADWHSDCRAGADGEHRMTLEASRSANSTARQLGEDGAHNVDRARLTCGQLPSQGPFPQAIPKRGGLVHVWVLVIFAAGSDILLVFVTVASSRSTCRSGRPTGAPEDFPYRETGHGYAQATDGPARTRWFRPRALPESRTERMATWRTGAWAAAGSACLWSAWAPGSGWKPPPPPAGTASSSRAPSRRASGSSIPPLCTATPSACSKIGRAS